MCAVAGNFADDIRRAVTLTRREWLLTLLFMVCSGYFNGGSLWCQNSRFDAAMAFVEPGYPETMTFCIDRFLHDPNGGDNTGDWSYYRGHFYSNKAPGTILLAAAVYFPLFHFERLVGANPHGPYLEILNLYVINLCVSAFAVAVALVCFRRLLRKTGTGEDTSYLIAAVLGFCTMLLPYSTQFWGHVTAASWIIAGLCMLEQRTDYGDLATGFCMGMATLCEYFCALTVVLVGLYLLIREPRRILRYIIGGILPLLAFAAYHSACFGSPFVLATHYFNPIFKTEGRMFGFFRFSNLVSLLVGRYRGLLLHMPVLLGTIPACVLWFRRNRRDALLWLCIANQLSYLFLNASFNGWHGGSTVCARYQIPALVFWILPLKELCPYWEKSRSLRIVLAVAVCISFCNMFVVSTVSPTSPYARPEGPAEYYNPLYGWSYRMFSQGAVSPFRFSLTRDSAEMWRACNLGHILGLKGLLTLLPLVLGLGIGICGFLWIREPQKTLQDTGDAADQDADTSGCDNSSSPG